MADTNNCSSGWSKKTREEIIDGSLALFKEIVGDVPIQSVERKMVAQFKRTIVCLPSNRNKKPAYKGKCITELLKMEIEQVLFNVDIKGHMLNLSAWISM